MQNDDILTLAEVAARLRCSKAHVAKLVGGRIKRVPPLPALNLGRRKLVRRTTLEEWIAQVESADNGGTIRASKIFAVDA